MRILDAESMRQVDRSAIEEFGIPSMVLMENAAIGLADALADSFPDATTASIFLWPRQQWWRWICPGYDTCLLVDIMWRSPFSVEACLSV